MEDYRLFTALRSLARELKPRRYLEIGVREGDSLRIVVEEAKPDRVVICDTWKGTYGGTNRGSADHVIPILQSVPSYQVLSGDSKLLIPTLNETFDLITIDGDHSEEGCRTDMENCWPLLITDGRMVVDDLAHPAHKYLEKVFDDFAATHKSAVKYKSVATGFGLGVLIKL